MSGQRLSNAYICPFCGSQDIVTEYYFQTGSWKVFCRSCHREEMVDPMGGMDECTTDEALHIADTKV